MDHVGYLDSNSGARRLSTNVVEKVGFALVLALPALLRVWHVNQSGFGTQYYAAGVLSMLQSRHNFFFNSFDPAGFVSVDKPPLALWLQVASARVLGFSGMSIHLPQVIEGVVAVALLYHLVRRRFGAPSALLAALFLAVTPISVAIDRSNNTDSALVLGLLAAAWARGRWTRCAPRTGQVRGRLRLLPSPPAARAMQLPARVWLDARGIAYRLACCGWRTRCWPFTRVGCIRWQPSVSLRSCGASAYACRSTRSIARCCGGPAGL
jgi:Dolichyl-phosphate-mannose-protein mannosyltransferase